MPWPTVNGKKNITTKPGEWIECTRYKRTPVVTASHNTDCYVHRPRPFDVKSIGPARDVRAGKELVKERKVDGSEITTIVSSPSNGQMKCVYDKGKRYLSCHEK
jgi:hypothetical protein